MRPETMRARYGNVPAAVQEQDIGPAEYEGKYSKPVAATSQLQQQYAQEEEQIYLLRKLFHMAWGIFFICMRHSMMRRLYKYDRIIGKQISLYTALYLDSKHIDADHGHN